MPLSRRITIPFCLALAVALPACRSSGAAGASADELPAARRDPRRVMPEEVAEALGQHMQSMFDLVAAKHMDWLRNTATLSGAHQVTVYLDRARLGGPDQMRTVALAIVESARYLTPSEAQAEFGLDNLGGAISITSHHQ
jgi:hypothetical protein